MCARVTVVCVYVCVYPIYLQLVVATTADIERTQPLLFHNCTPARQCVVGALIPQMSSAVTLVCPTKRLHESTLYLIVQYC